MSVSMDVASARVTVPAAGDSSGCSHVGVTVHSQGGAFLGEGGHRHAFLEGLRENLSFKLV